MTKNPIGTPSRDCGTHNRSPSPSLWSVAAQRQGFVQSLKMGTAGGGEEGRRGPPGKMHLGQKGSTGKPPQGGGCRDPPSKGWCPRGGRHRGTSAGRCCGVRADREPPRGGGSAASGKEGRTRKAEPDAVPVPPISPRFPPVPPPPTCPGRASNAAAVRQRGAPSGCARRSAGLRGGTGTGGGTGGHGGHRLQSAPARPGLPHPPRSPAPPPPPRALPNPQLRAALARAGTALDRYWERWDSCEPIGGSGACSPRRALSCGPGEVFKGTFVKIARLLHRVRFCSMVDGMGLQQEHKQPLCTALSLGHCSLHHPSQLIRQPPHPLRRSRSPRIPQ